MSDYVETNVKMQYENQNEKSLREKCMRPTLPRRVPVLAGRLNFPL